MLCLCSCSKVQKERVYVFFHRFYFLSLLYISIYQICPFKYGLWTTKQVAQKQWMKACYSLVLYKSTERAAESITRHQFHFPFPSLPSISFIQTFYWNDHLQETNCHFIILHEDIKIKLRLVAKVWSVA